MMKLTRISIDKYFYTARLIYFYIESIDLAVKTLLYSCKGKNTSLISRKRIYWEGQL